MKVLSTLAAFDSGLLDLDLSFSAAPEPLGFRRLTSILISRSVIGDARVINSATKYVYIELIAA